MLCSLWDKSKGAERCRETLEQLTLEDVLPMTADSDAQDPRDQVFALLGMLPDDSSTLKLEYSIPVKESYQKVTLEAIRSSSDLNFLMHTVFPRGQDNFSLPFWCLDFSVPNWDRYKGKFRNIRFRRTGYTLDLPFKIEHDLTKGLLRIIDTPIGSVHVSHDSTTKAILQRSGTSIYKRRRTILTMDCNLLTERAILGLWAVLKDYIDSRDLLSLALTQRLGPGKAMNLLDEGITWKILAGGAFSDWEFEFRELSNKEKISLEYFFAVAKWADDYISNLPSITG